MTDKKAQEAETGPDTVQAQPQMPHVDSTIPPIEAPATGPSLQLVTAEDDEIANLRVQTVHCGGEACGLDKISKKELNGEQGHVVIVADASLQYGGDQILGGAVGSRARMPVTLRHNDGKGADIKGDFVVSRLSPARMFNGEQMYTLVLENAGPEPKAEEE